MSTRDSERLAFAARIIFYGTLWYMGVYAFYLTGGA